MVKISLEKSRIIRVIAVAGLIVLGNACTTTRQNLPPVIESSGDSRERSQPPVEAPPKSVKSPTTAIKPAGAVVALLDKADDYRISENYSAEAATIERALRIDPHNAQLWSRLAATRLQQGRPEQSEQLALKSNALSKGERALQVANWKIIARARWARDDPSGAKKAEQKAASLK